MDRFINQKKGFTLIEVIVSITLLSLLVVSFATLVGFNASTVFNSGKKNEALIAATEKSDKLYEKVVSAPTPNEAEKALKATPGYVTGKDQLNSSVKTAQFYYVKQTMKVGEEDVDGFTITVVVFYSNGNFRVELESFVLKQIID